LRTAGPAAKPLAKKGTVWQHHSIFCADDQQMLQYHSALFKLSAAVTSKRLLSGALRRIRIKDCLLALGDVRRATARGSVLHSQAVHEPRAAMRMRWHPQPGNDVLGGSLGVDARRDERLSTEDVVLGG
jgi:hypothetical protein